MDRDDYGGVIVSIEKGANQGKRRQVGFFRHEFDLAIIVSFGLIPEEGMAAVLKKGEVG